MNTEVLLVFLTEHGREILLVLVSVLVVRGVKLLLRRRRESKEIRKEREQAEKLMRDEALNNEILNPDRRPGDVSEQKHPYKVEYSDNHLREKDMRRKAFQGGHAAGGARVSGRNSGGPGSGTCLKVTESSSLSRSSYMFRNDERMRVGSQYGKTGILAGDSGDSLLYFEIIFQNDHYYLISNGAARVTVTRGGSRKELGREKLVLCDNDRVIVDDKVYEIHFF